jgi:hypothetical protein
MVKTVMVNYHLRECLPSSAELLDCDDTPVDNELQNLIYWKRLTTRLLPRQKSLYINTLSDFRGKAATRF